MREKLNDLIQLILRFEFVKIVLNDLQKNQSAENQKEYEGKQTAKEPNSELCLRNHGVTVRYSIFLGDSISKALAFWSVFSKVF